MLDLIDVSLTFNKHTVNERKALDHLNLHLEAGDFMTVIGSNGAGKSTMLNVISGTYEPDCGQVFIDGKEVTYMKEHRRAAMIGHLFQDPMKGTAPHMTIEENLGLAYCRASGHHPLSLGIRKKEQAYFYEQLKALGLGLEDRMKSEVGLLSGGQRQALTLMMATIVTPKILLLDEHTAALDPKTSEQVMKITEEIVSRHQITTLMITHNISNALKYGNKTLVMSEGKAAFILEGEERKTMSVEKLISLYSSKTANEFSDRMIFK